MDLWDWIRWLHLLGMAFFVGGQLFLAVVVVPVLRLSSDTEAMRAVARRFGYATLVALGVLLTTGVAQASHEHRWSDSLLQAKLGVVALIGLLIAAHVARPRSRVLDAALLVSSLAVVAMGVALAH
jgi:uncharacterized membrane protein